MNLPFDDFYRDIFPNYVKLYVRNDAVAALASGTMGKLHGCVLIAGTGTIAYGFTEDGREARAAGAGPVLGDWGRCMIVLFLFLASFFYCLFFSLILNSLHFEFYHMGVFRTYPFNNVCLTQSLRVKVVLRT